jgi:protein SCO1/2
MAIDAPTHLEPPPPPPPPSRTRGPISIIVVAALVIAAVGVLAFVRSGNNGDNDTSNSANWSGTLIEPGRQRPSFTLTDTGGQPYDFAAQTSGQLTFLFFGYTNCPDVCPITMANLTAALDHLTGVGAKVVFVTTDPSRDTPERLSSWLSNFPGDVVGLTGSVPELEAAQKAAGVSTAIAEAPDANGKYTVGHSASVMTYTPDDQEHLIFPSGMQQSQWTEDIPRMVANPAWNAVDGVAVTGAYAGPSTAGQSAVYLTVVNGGEDDAVVGVTSPDAPEATLHVTGAGGAMSDTDSLAVPRGGSTTLSPAGDHIMLSGLARDLVPGDTVTVVLQLRHGLPVTVVAPIVSYDALAARIPTSGSSGAAS